MFGCLHSDLLFDILAFWLLLSGVMGFMAMGIDKARAGGGGWRIPELTLFAIAFAGGTFGVAAGSVAFHHKTSKLGFMAVLLVSVVVWLFILQRVGFVNCLSTSLPP
jgi:uncharacterized membrane protein YsdA (DUF1294 family)